MDSSVQVFIFNLLTSTNCDSAGSFTSWPTITIWMPSVANINPPTPQKRKKVKSAQSLLTLTGFSKKEIDWLSLMKSPGVALTLGEDWRKGLNNITRTYSLSLPFSAPFELVHHRPCETKVGRSCQRQVVLDIVKQAKDLYSRPGDRGERLNSMPLKQKAERF